jgi:hypothetical protein
MSGLLLGRKGSKVTGSGWDQAPAGRQLQRPPAAAHVATFRRRGRRSHGDAREVRRKEGTVGDDEAAPIGFERAGQVHVSRSADRHDFIGIEAATPLTVTQQKDRRIDQRLAVPRYARCGVSDTRIFLLRDPGVAVRRRPLRQRSCRRHIAGG